MSTVINFYRFLMRTSRMQFLPANPPWVDRDVSIQIEYRDTEGIQTDSQRVVTDRPKGATECSP
jgi:hypothetical protein